MKAWVKYIPNLGLRVKKIPKHTIGSFDNNFEKIKESSELIPLTSPDFRDRKTAKGKFYTPQFELILSKLEGDYDTLSKTAKPVRSLWDFLTLTTFFLVFAKRTKEFKEANVPVSKLSKSGKKVLIDFTPGLVRDIPKAISNLEVYSYCSQSLLPNAYKKKAKLSKKHEFPFNQHPIYEERELAELSLVSSYWCVYTPDCLLWLRDKRSKYNPRNLNTDSFTYRLTKALGDNDLKDFYFHPDSILTNIRFVETPIEYIILSSFPFRSLPKGKDDRLLGWNL